MKNLCHNLINGLRSFTAGATLLTLACVPMETTPNYILKTDACVATSNRLGGSNVVCVESKEDSLAKIYQYVYDEKEKLQEFAMDIEGDLKIDYRESYEYDKERKLEKTTIDSNADGKDDFTIEIIYNEFGKRDSEIVKANNKIVYSRKMEYSDIGKYLGDEIHFDGSDDKYQFNDIDEVTRRGGLLLRAKPEIAEKVTGQKLQRQNTKLIELNGKPTKSEVSQDNYTPNYLKPDW